MKQFSGNTFNLDSLKTIFIQQLTNIIMIADMEKNNHSSSLPKLKT